MTTQAIIDRVMSERYEHDRAEGAILDLLDLIGTIAGESSSELDETPENRRLDAATQLVEYFHKRNLKTRP